MKSYLVMMASLSLTCLSAENSTFSPDRMKGFYNGFLCEEKQELALRGLTGECSFVPPPSPPIPVPPSNPAAPPFKAGYLPIVLVNNSGLPDSQVYVLITGVDVAGQNQVWGDVNNAGVVTLVDVQLGQNSQTYSEALSSLPKTTDGRVLYVPQMRSGIVWLSMEKTLSMPVNVNPSSPPPYEIVQPNFTSSADPNYATNFDIFEFTYLLAGSPQVSADATAVSFFSQPLYGYLSGATTSSANTGLYQPRSYIMSRVAQNLASAVESSEWEKLMLRNGSSIYRVLAPGKSMSTSAFDPNYLDHLSAYGYSYISDIWKGVGSFYKTQPLNMSVTVTNPSTATYTYEGNVQGDNTFLFTSSDGGPDVTFVAPQISPTPTGTTSYNIFSGLTLLSSTPTAGTAGDAISKLFEEAIIAGLLPTTNTLSLDYLSQNIPNYYQVNSNLTSPGGTTGPWYDLYSKSLHGLGSIYTYAYDDALWPDVLIGGPYQNNSTYLGITIGSVE